jgi:hypothetical protein
MPKVWLLKPTTYSGVVPGAQHYMGYLYRPHQPGETDWLINGIEVERELDAAGAAQLNKTEDDSFQYRAGMMTSRFMDRESFVAAAVAQWWALADSGDVLADYFGDVQYEHDLADVEYPEDIVKTKED